MRLLKKYMGWNSGSGSRRSWGKGKKSPTRERSLQIEALEKRELLDASGYLDADSSSGETVYTFNTSGRLTASFVHQTATYLLKCDFNVGDETYTLYNDLDKNAAENGNNDPYSNNGSTFSIEVKKNTPYSINIKNQTTTVYPIQTQGLYHLEGNIYVEDWTDADFDDMVITMSFESFEDPHTEKPKCEACERQQKAKCIICRDSVDNNDPVSTYPDTSYQEFFRLNRHLLYKMINGVESAPTLLQATLQMSSTTTQDTLTRTVYYAPTAAFTPEDLYTIAMNADTTGFASGRYDWEMTVVSSYADGSSNALNPERYTGAFSIVNLDDSPYGAGWNLTGLSSLRLTNLNSSTNRGVHWERSCGKTVWFDYDGTTFTPEAGESSLSTLVLNQDGTFTLVDNGERFTFDASGKLTYRESLVGGETTTWTYNVDGTAATKTDQANRVTRYTYSVLNGQTLLTKATDFAGRETTYTYDALGRRTSMTEPDPDGTGLLTGRTTSFQYEGSTSQVSQVTDPEGVVTTYTYDHGIVVSKSVNGVLQESLEPFYLSGVVTSGGTLSEPAVLPMKSELEGEYAKTGSQTAEIRTNQQGQVVWQRTASGRETTFAYDEDGRLLREVESVTVAGSTEYAVTQYEYDARGNQTRVTYTDGSTEEWTYDGVFDQVTSYTDALGNRTLYTVDSVTGLTTEERQVVGEADSASNGETDDVVTLYTYNASGLVTSQTDALGCTTVYTYDAHGNMLTETAAYGTALAATTTYTYDSADRVTSVTDALGRVTDYAYDALDRLVQVTYPAAALGAVRQTTQSVYNALGQLAQSIDSYGAVTTYTYNANGQIAQITYPDPDGTGVQQSASVTYTYNAAGDVLTETDSLGRVTRYEYTSGGRLAAIYSESAGETVSLSSTTYDAWGRTATETDAAGVTLAYTYDSMGRVSQIRRVNDDVLLETRTYDAAGQLTASADALGGTTTYGYDALGNVVYTVDAVGAVTRYTYDKLGQVLSVTDALGNVTSYTYDVLGNLKSQTDALGNTVVYTYDGAGQLLTQTDALGNVTSYTYDGLGRNVSVTLSAPAGTPGPLTSTSSSTAYTTSTVNGVTYRHITTTDALNQSTTSTYDNAGRLIATTAADNTTTTYTYDREGQLLTQTDALVTDAGSAERVGSHDGLCL